MKPLQAILAAFLCVCSPMLAYSQNAVEEVFNSNDSSSQQTFTSEVDFSPLPPAPPVEEPSLDLGYEIEGCSDAQCTDTFDECVTDCQSPVWVNFSPYLWATQTKGTVTVEGWAGRCRDPVWIRLHSKPGTNLRSPHSRDLLGAVS